MTYIGKLRKGSLITSTGTVNVELISGTNNFALIADSTNANGMKWALVTAVGTITSGVWNGTAIGTAYGGTGQSTTATLGTILRGDGTNWSATTSTYPNTNAINTLLYASAANVMSALATANSGVLTTSSTGVPSIDTTNFKVLSTGVQMKGNNTNTTPPAGFIGERITSGFVGPSSIGSGTISSLTSVTLTPGIWDISGIGAGIATTNFSSFEMGIGATNGSFAGVNLGDNKFQFNTTINIISGVVPSYRVEISSNTTYYLSFLVFFSIGTATVQGRLSAVRVG